MASKRKWESYKGSIPKWDFNDKPEYKQRVEKRKEVIFEAVYKNADLGVFYRDNKLRKKELEEELEDINLNIEAVQQILTDRFENEGIQSMRLASGELLFLKDVPYSKIVDSPTVNKWFVEQGMDAMRTVQWTSLNALVKERLENGQPVPEGVSVFLKTSVEMRKG